MKLLTLLLLLLAGPAFAQNVVTPCVSSQNGAFSSCAPVTATNPLPVTLGTSGLPGVTSINTVAGAFTFTGSGVSCTTTTCTFTGGSSGITSLTGVVTGTGPGATATSFGTFSSATLAAALTDETGTGTAVFNTSPTLVTPALGTPSAIILTSGTGLPLTTGVTGTLPVANGGTGTGTAFTAGSVVYAGASGVYSQNNSNLFWDNTNTRLGIGTTTPASLLDIPSTTVTGQLANFGSGAVAASSAQYISINRIFMGYGGGTTFRATFQGKSGVGIDFNVNNNAFGAGQAMSIDSSGKVGIGTNVPNTLLDIRGGVAFKRTTVADAAYTILVSDYEIAYTSISASRIVSVACTLGAAAAPQYFIVKDESGSSSITNTIVVTPTSGTIDGAASKSITTAYGVLSFYSNGTNCFTK